MRLRSGRKTPGLFIRQPFLQHLLCARPVLVSIARRGRASGCPSWAEEALASCSYVSLGHARVGCRLPVRLYPMSSPPKTLPGMLVCLFWLMNMINALPRLLLPTVQ